MKKWLSLCLCMTCLLAVLSGCGQATIQRSEDVKKATKSEMQGIADKFRGSLKDVIEEGNKKFPRPRDEAETVSLSNFERAKAVFLKVQSEDGNSLYSPLSLEMALGLLSEGASGETRDQILSFLGTDEGYAETAEKMIAHAKDITNEANTGPDAVSGDYNTALNIANSLWVSNRYTMKSDFLGVANKSYDATSASLDFTKADESAKTINDWCSEHTKGLINGIVEPRMITPDLAMVLCNSVYFESGWWEPWSVRAGEFTQADGTKVVLNEFLYSTEGLYYETDNATAFGKQYINGSTFIGILPNEGVKLDDIDLDALIASKSIDYDVHASMPKLNYDFSCEQLVAILESLGVVNAFTPDAELDGLVNESNDIYVSDVLQKCKIELDENGTKAAAVTAMLAMDNAMMIENPTPVKEVHLTRPFYYMILDEATQQVLFIGSVNTI